VPGAPNRPPDPAPEPRATPPAAEPPERKVLRRLAPCRVALLLEAWKGAPSAEVIAPFEKAEAAYAAGDYANALSALDLLSIRFAEPRWPTLPEPFRSLRVPIPAPTPPHWDPEHGLAPADKEARRARRAADEQLALARASVEWLGTHGVDLADLAPRVAEARTLLETEGAGGPFFERIDAVWDAVRSRAPRPRVAAARAPPAAAAAASPTAGEV